MTRSSHVGGLHAPAAHRLLAQSASSEQAGLALGAWGAAQATAAGVAMAAGGVLRDLIASQSSPLWGYESVYVLEVVILLVTLRLMVPLMSGTARTESRT